MSQMFHGEMLPEGITLQEASPRALELDECKICQNPFSGCLYHCKKSGYAVLVHTDCLRDHFDEKEDCLVCKENCGDHHNFQEKTVHMLNNTVALNEPSKNGLLCSFCFAPACKLTVLDKTYFVCSEEKYTLYPFPPITGIDKVYGSWLKLNFRDLSCDDVWDIIASYSYDCNTDRVWVKNLLQSIDRFAIESSEEETKSGS